MLGNSITRRLAPLGIGLLLGACADRPTTPLAPDEPEAVLGSARSAAPAAVAQPVDGWGVAVSIDPSGLNNLNTTALEGCPAEAADGRALFFASNREGQIDIWVARRPSRSAAWGSPQKLPAPVNADGFNDFCPTPLPGGELLFVSTRPGGCGEGSADLYRTRAHPTHGWEAPEHLGCEVNSAGNEFSPSYVAAGGGLLFFSSDREGGPGQDRLYVSRRQPGGAWASPVDVAELNASGFSTARPNVSQDGRVIVFDSNRPGGLGGPDIWLATRASVTHAWSSPWNLGPSVNSASAEVRAWLSADGQRLYFGSNREGGEGNLDIYVSTRR